MSNEPTSMDSSPAFELAPADNSPSPAKPEMDLTVAEDEVTTRHDYFYFSEVIFLVSPFPAAVNHL
jgi:hypothetical protein